MKMITLLLLLPFCSFCFATEDPETTELEQISNAVDTGGPTEEEQLEDVSLTQTTENKNVKAEESGEEDGDSTTPLDWKWSAGIGIEQYRTADYIRAATVRGENKIVVIQDSVETLPSFWLTMNWNVFGIEEPINNLGNNVRDARFGLFAGIKLLDSNSGALSGVAIGPQVTWVTEHRDISLGIGWVAHQLKTLADGITEGAPLPSHFDDIEYKTSTENSYMLMMSVSF